MPTLYGDCRTTIELSVADFTQTTTVNPETKQCVKTTQDIATITTAFTQASENGTLAEASINAEDGFHLRFLGERQNMPFYLVRAGQDFYTAGSPTRKRTRRPAVSVDAQLSPNASLYDSTFRGRFQDELIPTEIPAKRQVSSVHPIKEHALSINIFLSPKSFLFRDCFDKRQIKQTVDIKIDVYLNGLLLESRCVPYSQFRASGSRAMKARMIRITGQRIHRMIEKPLVLAPARSHDGIAQLQSVVQGHGSLKQRWDLVSDALRDEAIGYECNESGNSPVIGEYLRSLATLPMPIILEDIPDSIGSNLGIIDVVIIRGAGRKDDPNAKYMTEPTRVRVHQAKTTRPNVKTSINQRQPQDQGPQPRITLSEGSFILDGSSDSPSKPTNDHPLFGSIALTTSKPPTQPTTSSRKPHSKPPTNRFNSRKRSRQSSLSSQQPLAKRQQRRRLSTEYVANYRPTAEEEFRTISENSKVSAEPIVTAPKDFLDAEKADLMAEAEEEAWNSSPLSSLPPEEKDVSFLEDLRPSKIVKLKISPWKALDFSAAPRVKRGPLADIPEDKSDPLPSAAAHVRADGDPMPPVRVAAAPALEGPMAPSAAPTGKETLDAHFQIPALCQNSCVTFASMGILRNVGAMRGGSFEEQSVVMGARFIVG